MTRDPNKPYPKWRIWINVWRERLRILFTSTFYFRRIAARLGAYLMILSMGKTARYYRNRITRKQFLWWPIRERSLNNLFIVSVKRVEDIEEMKSESHEAYTPETWAEIDRKAAEENDPAFR